jgi:3-oxoacyl-[acyl-carrier-protein] synthase II
VNAHASSTRVGDKVEDEALHDVFGDKVPPVSANKSQFGHAMGAASILESLLTLEGMRDGVLLPTINFTRDPDINLDVVTETRPHPTRTTCSRTPSASAAPTRVSSFTVWHSSIKESP